MAGLTGPGTRRREQFDDEDEWEDLVIEQKHTQQQGALTTWCSAGPQQDAAINTSTVSSPWRLVST
jgi:hypothetical protein